MELGNYFLLLLHAHITNYMSYHRTVHCGCKVSFGERDHLESLLVRLSFTLKRENIYVLFFQME